MRYSRPILAKECLRAKRFLPKVTEYKVKCPQMELSLCHDIIAWDGGSAGAWS